MVKSYGVVVGVRVAHVIIVSAPVQILGFCFFLNLVYELRVRILSLLVQGTKNNFYYLLKASLNVPPHCFLYKICMRYSNS